MAALLPTTARPLPGSGHCHHCRTAPPPFRGQCWRAVVGRHVDGRLEREVVGSSAFGRGELAGFSSAAAFTGSGRGACRSTRRRPSAPIAAGAPPDEAAQSIQAMLDEGAPLARVYAGASSLMAGTLSLGLTPDQARAWTTLRALLKQASRRRRRASHARRSATFDHAERGAHAELVGRATFHSGLG